MKTMWKIYHEQIPEFLMEFMELDIMRRIKNVGMNCGCEYTSFPLFQQLAPYSRYDHSVGCALIIWHFTHDKAQTLSGLFHDVSAPAFSHVIDFLHHDHKNQEFTEAKTEEILNSSAQLQKLLEKHSLTLAEISDYHRYPIADNDSPQLSSDRLEYTLSNLVNYGFCSMDEVQKFYQDLRVELNEKGEMELCFTSKEIAEEFALSAMKMARIYVADADRLIMQLLSDVIEKAIQWDVLCEEDLYADEIYVTDKLKKDERCAKMWEAFCALNEVHRQKEASDAGLKRQIDAKKRWINPMSQGARIFEISPEFQRQAEEFLAQDFNEILVTKNEIPYL